MAKRKRQHCYDYPRPALTADIAVFTLHEGGLKLLLIRRKIDPFAGRWALPGGFVNEGERVMVAAHRELEEETGVTGATLHEFATFSDPGRDPRGWTVTVAHHTLLAWDRLRARASDDAAAVGWFSPDKLPPLAFDHDKIIPAALAALREHPLRVLATSGCLPRRFGRAALRNLLGMVLGKELTLTALLQREPDVLRRIPAGEHGTVRYSFR